VNQTQKKCVKQIRIYEVVCATLTRRQIPSHSKISGLLWCDSTSNYARKPALRAKSSVP